MRIWQPCQLVLVLIACSHPTRAGEFPRSMIDWVPAAVTPVFQGAAGDAWDRKIRERGWIVVGEDGTYHLWYTGYNDDRSPLRLLGHATSADGVRWARDPANPIVVGDWVEDVCVVRKDGTFYLFAEGEEDIAHLLTSTDGAHWTERGPLDIRRVDGTPIAPGSRGTPTAWVEDGTWYLFYERGDQGAWLAASKDGEVWTNLRDDPVIKMGPEATDRYAVAVNQVVKRGGTYYAYYHANAHQPWKDRSTCIARSTDLIHWEKYPGNPIVGDNCSSGILVDGPQGRRLYTMHPEVRIFESPAASGPNP